MLPPMLRVRMSAAGKPIADLLRGIRFGLRSLSLGGQSVALPVGVLIPTGPVYALPAGLFERTYE